MHRGGPEIGGGCGGAGGRARGGEERAAKMWLMFVTLDVSNFSGWSNDIAPCMVKGRREKRLRGTRMPVCVAGYP